MAEPAGRNALVGGKWYEIIPYRGVQNGLQFRDSFGPLLGRDFLAGLLKATGGALGFPRQKGWRRICCSWRCQPDNQQEQKPNARPLNRWDRARSDSDG